MTKWITGILGAAVLAAVASLGVSAQGNQMSFFITSAGPGNGANLGGLAGADKHCQTLAAAAGAGNRTWRAYLSAAAAAGQPAVNAKDRIGKGPWMNVKGVVDRQIVADLHSDMNNAQQKRRTPSPRRARTVNGVGDTPNQHDILTGSQADGTVQTGANATRRAATGPAPTAGQARWWAIHDRQGGGAPPARRGMRRICRKDARRTNSSRPAATVYFYCFAN